MLTWNRRQFLSGVLVAASAGTVVSAEALIPQETGPIPPAPVPSPTSVPPSTATALSHGHEESAQHPLQELLPEGLRFGRWQVVSVLPVKLGAVPVLLKSRRGEQFQVDILRRDRSTRARRGLSETQKYALFLLNRGRGDTPTLEDHGLAVLWLAALLRPRENLRTTPSLLTQRERTQRFPRGIFNALVPYTAPVVQPVTTSPAEPTHPTAAAPDPSRPA